MQRFVQSACMVLALCAGTLPAVAQSFSGKGIVLWDHTAFGQANQSPSPAWDEFKTFIQSTDTGLGGTIYKDCSDGYFVHYTPSTATAMVDLAQLSPPVKVALGAAMVSCQASAGDACGVTDAQAISTFIQNLSQHDVNTLSPVYGGYVDLWLDFEPHDVNLMSFYMGNLQSIRNIVDTHNTAAGSTGLKLRLVPFISNGLRV